jgi:hypothetical protein
VDHVLAIATSPVREAANGPAFIAEAEAVLGLRIKVLSGKEEALYSYIGASRATRLSDVLFFDLGGGSLEFTYARGYRVRKILSLPLGALRMTELYGRPEQRFNKKDYDRMRRRIAELLPSRQELGINEGTSLLGVGGTIRALARYDQWIREYPLNKLHNYRMRRKSVAAMNKRLRKMSPRKVGGIEVIGRERSESVAAGALVVGTLMSRLGFDEVVVSTHGIRDGVLSEFLRDQRGYYSDQRFDERRANASLGRWRSKETRTGALTDALASKRVLSLSEKMIPGHLREDQGGEALLRDHRRGQLPRPPRPGGPRHLAREGEGTEDGQLVLLALREHPQGHEEGHDRKARGLHPARGGPGVYRLVHQAQDVRRRDAIGGHDISSLLPHPAPGRGREGDRGGDGQDCEDDRTPQA